MDCGVQYARFRSHGLSCQSTSQLKSLMRNTWPAFLTVIFTTVLMTAPHEARAGTTLHLKSGSIDTSSAKSRLPQRFNSSTKDAYHYVVQFKDRIRAQDRKNLTSLGAEIVRYLPDDAFVISATDPVVKTILKSTDAIQVVLPYEPSWKLSDDFGPASVFTAPRVHEAFVILFPGQNDVNATQALEAISGVEVIRASGRWVVIQARRSKLEAVAELESVEWVQPNPEMQPLHLPLQAGQEKSKLDGMEFSELTGYEDGTKLMNFASAWSRSWNGSGQIVAMADTGLDSGDRLSIHGDFADWIPTGFYYGLFSKSWADPMGHGTHVAGSVMGRGVLSEGRVTGGATGAELIPQGMWSPMLGNLSVPPRLRDLFEKAYAEGARIHTNSWGSPRDLGAYDGFAQQVDEYIFENPDMLILFAAGNSGVDHDRDGRIDPGSIGSPGTAKNVLTVGASKNYVLKGGIQNKLKELRAGPENWGVEPLGSSRLSENPQGLAAFSSRGPTRDGRLKPEVVAPGTNILSARSHHEGAEVLWGEFNGDYVWSGGTSMSTPLVAGAAAVVRQYLKEERKMESPSAAMVKAILMHSAVDLFPGQFGEIGKEKGQEILARRPNSDEGYGRVDVARATALHDAVMIDEQKGLAVGESHAYPIQVNASSKLTATLVYTDAPASAGAAKSLVNDLDLVLVDEQGKETTLRDTVNNSEMIEVEIEGGAYEVQVRGSNIPQGRNGRQPYALLVSVE